MGRFAILHFFFIVFCYTDFVFSHGIFSDLLPGTDECGEIISVDKIIGGDEIQRNEFPWLVLLEYENGKSTEFLCAGTLINNRYVVTAAHCARNPKLLNVRLGEHDVTVDPDCEHDKPPGLGDCSDKMISMEIEETIFHNLDDIALLRLKEEVSFSASVKPVCLPITQELLNTDFVEFEMTVLGWGYTDQKYSKSDVPLAVKVKVVRNNVCLRTGMLGNNIHERLICAGGEFNKDACQGDSGGPMLHSTGNTTEDNWYLVGIVARGMDTCGMEYIPGLYVRVTSYVSWIIKHLKP